MKLIEKLVIIIFFVSLLLAIVGQIIYPDLQKNKCNCNSCCCSENKTGDNLINQSAELSELKSWTMFQSAKHLSAYAKNIEEKGKQAAFDAQGIPFKQELSVITLKNMKKHQYGYEPTSGHWPAGEIDEVANRYIEYTISADKKKGTVIESITVPVFVKGGNGMNICRPWCLVSISPWRAHTKWPAVQWIGR